MISSLRLSESCRRLPHGSFYEGWSVLWLVHDMSKSRGNPASKTPKARHIWIKPKKASGGDLKDIQQRMFDLSLTCALFCCQILKAFMDGKREFGPGKKKKWVYASAFLWKGRGNSCDENDKNVPGDLSVALTGKVQGKIGSRKLSVVVSGVMERSEMEKMRKISQMYSICHMDILFLRAVRYVDL